VLFQGQVGHRDEGLLCPPQQHPTDPEAIPSSEMMFLNTTFEL
jgi:hypothetical protein